MGSISSSKAFRSAPWFAPVAVAALMGAVLAAATARHQRRAPDFDGDGRPDIAIWRRVSSGMVTAPTFFALTSSTNFSPVAMQSFPLGGNETDIPFTGDFDGDGKADFAIYRPDLTYAWFLRLSSQNYTAIATYQWGREADIPVAADYDNDGKTDLAVYRPYEGRWYILQAGTNFTTAYSVRWGAPGSVPVPGDYDGDGKLDLATADPGAEGDSKYVWYILQGGTGFRSAYSVKMGAATSTPAPADYDGDGRVDTAVYNPVTSTFTIRYATSSADNVTQQWGLPGDTPVSADYDGDGKADLAVFRPAAGYFILQAGTNFTTAFTRTSGVGGTATDLPVLGR
jgi:hypothetical protein